MYSVVFSMLLAGSGSSAAYYPYAYYPGCCYPVYPVVYGVYSYGCAWPVAVSEVVHEDPTKKELERVNKRIDSIVQILEKFSDRVNKLEKGLDTLETSTDTRIKDLDAKLKSQAKKTNKQLKALDSKIAGSTKALDDKIAGVGKSLDEKITGTSKALEDKIAGLGKALDDKIVGTTKNLDDKIAGTAKSLDDKIAGLGKALDDKIAGLGKSLDEKIGGVDKRHEELKHSLEIKALQEQFNRGLKELEGTMGKEKIKEGIDALDERIKRIEQKFSVQHQLDHEKAKDNQQSTDKALQKLDERIRDLEHLHKGPSYQGPPKGFPRFMAPGSKANEVPKMPPAEDLPMSASGKRSNSAAVIVVDVPADARLFLEGQATKATGTVRTFQTPDLAANATFYYNIRIELTRDGQTVTHTRRIAFQAGQQVRVAFDDAGGNPLLHTVSAD